MKEISTSCCTRLLWSSEQPYSGWFFQEQHRVFAIHQQSNRAYWLALRQNLCPCPAAWCSADKFSPCPCHHSCGPHTLDCSLSHILLPSWNLTLLADSHLKWQETWAEKPAAASWGHIHMWMIMEEYCSYKEQCILACACKNQKLSWAPSHCFKHNTSWQCLCWHCSDHICILVYSIFQTSWGGGHQSLWCNLGKHQVAVVEDRSGCFHYWNPSKSLP